ncbi:ZmpA/ZmpB/ZmpC family metallo-endopeptidase [Streptococcus suis]|uniref:ZmpA/ZmpB/ZmpC family metallo-endopeptidase n=1 Tax=Streptococcus suis TaxID=1307 RepID=UPI000CF4D2C5|nr:ZmpA/ZmpB/ZmpC family metallo-endopeptidase [Streptococcus suis]
MNLHFLQKKQHFGIRKFSIGVVSVALAVSFSVLGGQVAAAQEASTAPTSSLATSQTSPTVTEEATQVQAVSGQTEVVEEVASSQSATTSPQETPSQDSGLVETEPVVQDSATNQELAVSQTVVPSQAEPVQNQTVGGEQSAQVAGEVSPSIEPTESTSSATGDADMDLSQVEQPVVASPDQVSQPVQLSETLVEEATPTNQVVEEVVQPVLRSARMARSVAAQELAKLPLDANGKLMTSVSGVTVHQYLVVNSDGSSQMVSATAQPTTSQTSETVAQQVASLKDDFAGVTYESLYPHLSHQENFFEKIDLEKAIRQENGGSNLPVDQLQTLKQTAYMDMLDMRESFERVKAKIETTLTGIFEKSSQVNVEDIRRNKEKILAGLSYLDRQYSFEFGQYQAKDLILHYPRVFGGGGSPLNTLSILNTLTYRDLTLGQSATAYQTKLAPITNQADIFSFVEKGVSLFEPGKTGEQWFKDTSKAHLAESQSPYGNSSLYQKLKSNVRLNNHFIPLLTLPSDLVYAISTSNTVNYGLTESYVRPGDQTGMATFKANLQSYADDQESFLKFWHRISQNRDILANHEAIIVVDSPQKLGTATQRVQELYSPKYGSGVLEGVEKFIRPLSLYANFLQADGQANGKTSINLFLKKSLSEAGQSVYTHELTHMLDKNVWLNGYDRRAGQLQEVFARGMFESMDVAKTPYQDPSFIINTAYRMGDNRTQNASPDRFQTSDDLKTYMQGILDVIYTLDYAEAQSILKKAPDERAVLLNKISLIPNPANNGGGKTTEIVNSIDTASAANLQTIADFVDQGLISGRYKFNGMETRGTARTNSYYTIPLFEPIYAALQNDTGSGGDISFKRNAYELLGEYGYEKGMVAYVSGQYANDQAALTAIMPEYGGDLATFKKAMFDRRIAKVTELKSTSVASDFAAIQSLMDEAIAKDLERLKSNAANKVPLSTRVSAVQDLKKSIFQAYLKDTDDFRTSIYQEQVARDLYVTNGDEKSQDGRGTLDSPYQSLSYALAQAKNGDRIKLVDNIMHRQDKPFLLDKAVTIDGQGHRLSFRGPDVELGADVTFADLTLNMLADGSKQPNIYANGYHLTLDQVSTTMSQAQSDLRPTLIAGSRSGQPAGSHGKITILNGNSDTRFNTIYAGNADSVSNIPVTISILSDFVSVDQGIKLSGVNGEDVMGPVLVTSKSSSLKSIDGNGSWDNTVTIDTARIYGLNLQNIQTLELVNKADVSLASQVSEISTGVELESGTQLTIANDPVTLGSLSGQGTVIIPVESSLNVIGDIEGNVEVLVRGFEQDLSKNIDKEYIKVEGLLSPTARITLEKGYNRFDLVKDEIVYRLVELKQPVQTHTVTLHFTQSGQLLKEKQVQVDNGQSITGVENDLPIATEGTYQLDPNFDRTVLTAITSSKTIEIPVVLVLPKASRYQPHVNGEAHVLPASSSEETTAEIVKQISLLAEAGQFDVVVVTPIPQSSGDHSMTVRVVYDDRSQEELVVPLHILTIKNGEVAKHSLPAGVLEPLVIAKGKGVTHELPVGILPPLETANGGGVRHELPAGVLEPLVTAKGKGVTHELPVGILPPLETANGGGVRHELPAGVLEPLVTAKGKGVTHELPVGILPPLETANGGGVRHELPAGVLEPLVTAKGKGVTHELPVGILPPLETANGGALLHSLPTFSVDAIVQLLNAGHKISLGLLDGAIWSTGDGLDHSLPSLEIAKGSSVNHQLLEGTLPLMVTSKGASISHFLPEGILPLLVTAKGKGVTHFIPSGTLPLTVTRSEAYTPAMPAVSLLQQRQKNTETKPAVLPLVAVPQKQADQLSATLTSSNSATSTSNRLPETGERNNLSLLGFLLASLGFSFWIGRKKAE